MTPRELWCRLRGRPHPREADPDLADEIASHLEMAKADYLRRGMTEAEAQRLAAMNFGSVAAAREQVWEQRHAPGISIVQDVRYAGRGMRKSPGFTAVTIATLALGIGLCSAIYALLTGIMRPLPGVPAPEGLAITMNPVPYPWFEHYREQGRGAWDAAAFIGPAPFGVAVGGGAAERTSGLLVSPEYFTAIGVRPLLGRFFDPRFEKPGGEPAAVVTERFWRTRLRADPRAIGRTLRVNGRAVPIIGVAPRDFYGILMGPPGVPEIFIPATANAAIAPELRDDVLHRTARPVFRVVLRLAHGITMAAAEARLDAATRAFDHGQRQQKGRVVRLVAAGTLLPMPKEVRAILMTFWGVMMLVILGLTCANLGGLLLARGAARRREFAIRLATGADQRRLVRQLLTESMVVAAAGGLGGFAAAHLLFHLLRKLQTASNPMVDAFMSGPDLRVALFTFAISTLAVAGFGLLPALSVTRLDLSSMMKANLAGGIRRYRHFGMRNLFVVSQVAAAMMLMLVMGFFVVGARYGVQTEPGFNTAPLSFFSMDPARDGLSSAESAEVLRALPERLARVAGVESVSLADRPPLSNTFPETKVTSASRQTRPVVLQSVGPGYFTTLGVKVLRGTEFGPATLLAEGGSAKVLPVAINQTAAIELFGERDPLGARLEQGERTFEVAAVVRYAPRAMLMGRPIPTVFLPLTAKELERAGAGGTTVVVRARTPIGVATLGREVAAIDSRLTLFQPQTMQEYVAQSERAGSSIAAIYSPIGLFGLALACIGLAGVTAQTVERRAKEIGIRTALGARRAQVLRLVMGEGAVMVIVGAALGYGGASGFVRLLSAVSAPVAQFVGPVASNPVLTVGIPSFLIALAAIACYVPARRAASIDPVATLREE